MNAAEQKNWPIVEEFEPVTRDQHVYRSVGKESHQSPRFVHIIIPVYFHLCTAKRSKGDTLVNLRRISSYTVLFNKLTSLLIDA